MYDSWQNFKQQIEDERAKRNAATEASIAPEEHTQVADTIRNQMIGGLGLPSQWQNTTADEKRLAAQPQAVEASNPFLEMSVIGPEAEGLSAGAKLVQKLAPELENMGRFQKLRGAIGSKFAEPRAVMKSPSAGIHEISIPQQHIAKTVTVSGSTPQEALTAYDALYGPGQVIRDSQKIIDTKRALNLANPEEVTQIMNQPNLNKIAGMGGMSLGANSIDSNKFQQLKSKLSPEEDEE